MLSFKPPKNSFLCSVKGKTEDRLKENRKHFKNCSPLTFSNQLTFAMSKGQEFIEKVKGYRFIPTLGSSLRRIVRESSSRQEFYSPLII